MNTTYDFQNIFSHFSIEGELTECERYGEGLINETYCMTVNCRGNNVRYILQRINHRLFKEVDKLMQNIELVTECSRKSVLARGGDPEHECLNLIRTKEGKSYYCDGTNYFRVYKFIENAIVLNIVRTPEDFYECAVAFGDFANLLSTFDASKLYEVLPNFHNTKIRYKNFVNAVEKNIAGRKDEVQKEIDWVIAHKDLCGKLVDKLESGELPLRVTHNDTKLNNVMLDAKTGKAVAVIDLDTIMPGLLAYDFGDSIRSGCNSAAEDEPETSKVHFRYDLYETYLRGYLSSVGKTITEEERKSLPVGGVLMTYECGMRFLTDYLEGDTYFRTMRKGQNLDRARTQFKLVDEMLENFDRMEKAALTEGRN